MNRTELTELLVDWVVLTAIISAFIGTYQVTQGAPISLQTAVVILACGGLSAGVGSVLFARARANNAEATV